MKVTITVENDDQDVEISRSRADVMSPRGRVDEPAVLAQVLDLAVADVRRACDLPTPTRAYDGEMENGPL